MLQNKPRPQPDCRSALHVRAANRGETLIFHTTHSHTTQIDTVINPGSPRPPHGNAAEARVDEPVTIDSCPGSDLPNVAAVVIFGLFGEVEAEIAGKEVGDILEDIPDVWRGNVANIFWTASPTWPDMCEA